MLILLDYSAFTNESVKYINTFFFCRADIIFLPYNYLVDPRIRKTLSVDLAESVVSKKIKFAMLFPRNVRIELHNGVFRQIFLKARPIRHIILLLVEVGSFKNDIILYNR